MQEGTETTFNAMESDSETEEVSTLSSHRNPLFSMSKDCPKDTHLPTSSGLSRQLLKGVHTILSDREEKYLLKDHCALILLGFTQTFKAQPVGPLHG